MDINMHLSPNFQLREFLHNGSIEGVTADILVNLKRLAESLEVVRTMCGNRRLSINSGFRTVQHNAEVGGAKDSQHLYGKAADIEIEGMSPRVVQGVLKDWSGGLGSYTTWTHVDIRKVRARWEGP